MKAPHVIDRCSWKVRISEEENGDLFGGIRLETRRKAIKTSNRVLDRHSNFVIRNPCLRELPIPVCPSALQASGI
jgi:hypothetical protein